MIKRLALAGFTLAYVGLIVAADDSQPCVKQSEQIEHTDPAEGGLNVAPTGQRAQIDPKTGQLTSDAQGQDLPSASVVQGDVGLPPVEITTHSDGTVQAKLNGRFRTPLRATIGCDGRITTAHSEQPLESNANKCEEDK